LGMPLMYRHWSFGKRFARDEAFYKRGMRSLAYELVINADPCINYIMEENSMTMQALVLAHAAYGHNHFFKNNYQFQLWTQPDHIIDYLAFAKRYVSECEERHGQDAVESVLDAAHALMNQGVSRDLRPRPRNIDKREKERAARRRAHEEATYDDIYRTLPEITRERGQPADGTMLEFLHSHSSVIFQPAFNDRRFGGLNPYALGFAMMNDIKRISTEPSPEDREWFPEFAGRGDWMETLRQAWAEFR